MIGNYKVKSFFKQNINIFNYVLVEKKKHAILSGTCIFHLSLFYRSNDQLIWIKNYPTDS